MRASAALLALAFVLQAIGPAEALDPERREVVVVNARVWDGYEYKETFVPSTLNTVTVMSGEDSALAFVRTQEYYWPLSRRVYVDFERQRDIVEGTLRIEKDGVILAEEAAQVYSIVYPEGAVNGNGSLLWGDEAAAAFTAHQAEERAFARRLVESQRAQTAYERQLLEAGARRIDGAPAVVIPPPPPPPEPSLRLVTRPVYGHRIRLEPGTYDVSLWSGGREQPGTRRGLRVLDGSGRSTLVADIVPEERWTRPLPANSAAARIFARPGSVFYITLADATLFDEAEYLPVVSPQAEAVTGRPMWVRRKPSTTSTMTIGWDGATAPVSLAALKVEQTQGSGFGYRVRSAAAGEAADLTAFPITVPDGPAARRGTVATEDASLVREIVVVQPRRSALGLALALVPLACGLLLWAGRRRAQRRTSAAA
jgi:hypothetical protein